VPGSLDKKGGRRFHLLLKIKDGTFSLLCLKNLACSHYLYIFGETLNYLFLLS
jgi:hypothetical protein